MIFNASALSTKKIIIICVAWMIAIVLVEAYALVSTFNFSWLMSLADALNMNLLIAMAGYITFTSLRYYQPSYKNALYLLAWSVTLAILSTIAHRFMMRWNIFPHEAEYEQFLYASRMIRGILMWFMISLIGVISWVWFFLQEQRAGEKREQDTMKLAREAELASLRQQLQPHFLFNSLNSISALAGSRPDEARKMIQQLSDFLRGTIKKDDQQLVTLKEELKHLQLYLDIEKVRFGHRLRTVIDKKDEAINLMLPSLLLQPLVENAIKFGLYDTIGEITIRILAHKQDSQLVIRVENPFDPQTAQPKSGTGFGLNSVQRRLYLLYARNDLLTTQQADTTFITEVKIPQPV